MSEALIRVREFAQNCGCTPQNIYGHLKTYAAELEGHTFQGKGRQGVLLDGYAQDFLRSVMYPKEIADNALMDEINKLRAQLLQMGVENTRLASQLAATEGERDRALLEAGEFHKALTASQEAEEAKDAEIQDLREKHNQQHLVLAKAREDALHERQQAEKQQAELEAQLDAERAKNEALMGRGLLARIFNKGVD